MKEFIRSKAFPLKVDEGVCIRCRRPFSDENVFTDAGREETKITGLCERCFDEIALGDIPR
jgi:hypothetical protein